MKKKISIKEIAELSNVSTATVSRVLNNNGRFSEETKKRVLSVIEEHEYQINSVAKTLRMQKSNTIGMIVPDINNEFFASLINRIEKFFFEKGFSTIICNTDKDQSKEESYLKSLDSKLIDGLIFISGHEKVDESHLSRNIPIVCIDRDPDVSTNISIVGSNHYEGGLLATRHLIKKGCKKIVILTKEKNISSVNDRVKGYKQALTEASIEIDNQLFIGVPAMDKHNFELGKEGISQVIDKQIEFDGVFATNDWIAYGALKELMNRGYKVPKEVKIVGFDNDTIAKYSPLGITTINQNISKIAEEASTLLYNLMENTEKKTVDYRVTVPVNIIERETT
ncbi:LacI family DNA-binding transcriptional regulator [Desemzia sp. FAM 23991]|uniref:LacI family DNA-binding transcriptional regulator n=1 Tax=Desemzia sp. FAM 23991 TaxID=3259521 RepID=UPI0038868C6F